MNCNAATRAPVVFEGWRLTPEGAVVRREERVAVIADLHLGYEWARGARGDSVPAHSLAETLERLARFLNSHEVAHLVVAGDLIESPRPCERTAHDLRRLRSWLLDRGVRLSIVAGNHDRPRANSLTTEVVSGLLESLSVAGWSIRHGDRPLDEGRTISGHYHPVLKFDVVTAPCFLVAPGRIILPAFSLNVAGFDLFTAPLPADWLRAGFRCIASAGSDLLDFGLLASLRRAKTSARAARRKR
jgi:putative SbcD/Mre11-related phosphoesterase